MSNWLFFLYLLFAPVIVGPWGCGFVPCARSARLAERATCALSVSTNLPAVGNGFDCDLLYWQFGYRKAGSGSPQQGAGYLNAFPTELRTPKLITVFSSRPDILASNCRNIAPAQIHLYLGLNLIILITTF